MPASISLTLPDNLTRTLKDASRAEGVPSNKLIEKALEDYFFFRRFHSLQDRMIVKAQGVHTDQDVFERVS